MENPLVYLSTSHDDRLYHLYKDCPKLDLEFGCAEITVEQATRIWHCHGCPSCLARKKGLVPHYYAQPQSITEYEDTVTSGSASDSMDVPPPTPPISSPPPRKGITFGKLLVSIFLSFACGIFLTAFVLTENIQQEYEKQWLGGYGTGYDRGKEDGYNSGYNDGELQGYNDGYTQAKDAGRSEGYRSGYDKGYSDGLSDAYVPSYNSYSYSYDTGYYTTVYITATGSKYHEIWCSYLSKSCYSISLSDAKASGYTPCSRCNPPY